MKKFIMFGFVLLIGCIGPKGDPGMPGNDGAPGPVGSPGPIGDAGPQGSIGLTGPSGATGSTGLQGVPGLDSSPVTLIKLCSQEPIYPSVFVEYALCIDNKLYGVYSANGGFLTYLPPGGYSSNAIGSACNFTVATNCVIQ